MVKGSFLMLVVAYAPSVLTWISKDNIKLFTNDKHMDLNILVWSIIITYEHIDDEKFL